MAVADWAVQHHSSPNSFGGSRDTAIGCSSPASPAILDRILLVLAVNLKSHSIHRGHIEEVLPSDGPVAQRAAEPGDSNVVRRPQ